MKANELRIGNYVFDRDNKIIRIDFFSYIEEGYNCKFGMQNILKGDILHPLTEYTDYAKPIPLTEDWLIKLSPQIKDLGNSIFRVGRFKFIWKFSYKYWYVVDDMCGAYMTKIEFVHEFQNFWFVMNGQELKLASDSAQF